MSSEIHPTAVVLARAMLLLVGVIALALGGALYLSAAQVPVWQLALIVGFGVLSLLSAFFESSSGVVATFLTFLYSTT